MRINWFSPLPPARTDIGHYTARILPALAARMQVVLWTATPLVQVPRLPGVTVRQIATATPAALHAADATFYNLGNNALFHAEILDWARRVPGIVVLHDADIQHLLVYDMVERRGDGAGYIATMTELHGAEGEALARARLKGADVLDRLHDFPLLSPALTKTMGVVCHSRVAKARVDALDVPTALLDLPFAPSPLEDRAARAPGAPIRLVQFGYLGPNRSIHKVLAALAEWRGAHPDRADAVRFDVYGQLWPGNDVAARIADLRLEEVVRLHGFVDEADLDAAIAGADLVLNMRYPTLGEASGSQMRIWNAGVASLVTDAGWFAELPDDTVIKVAPGSEGEALAEALSRLGADPESLVEIGAAGRRRLEARHTPETYAEAIIRVVEDAGAITARASALHVGTLARSIVEGAATRGGSRIPIPPSIDGLIDAVAGPDLSG